MLLSNYQLLFWLAKQGCNVFALTFIEVLPKILFYILIPILGSTIMYFVLREKATKKFTVVAVLVRSVLYLSNVSIIIRISLERGCYGANQEDLLG